MRISEQIARFQIKVFKKNSLLRYLNEQQIIEQKMYLDSFSEPKDDFERMYLKNHFQMAVIPKYKRFIFNVTSLFILPFFWMWCLLKPQGKIQRETEEGLYIFLQCFNGKRIYPKELLSECTSFIELDYFNGIKLKWKDVLFILKFVKINPLLGWLIFRLSYKVALCRCIIDRYRPSAIIGCQELSPTAPVLTQFCEKNQVELINIMHGERLFDLGNSFAHFHRFYVWDEHYVRLFRKLRVSSDTKLIVHTPSVITIDLSKYRQKDKVSDFTYYMDDYYTKEEILALSSLGDKFSCNGYSIRFRVHPRFHDMELFSKYFREEQKEYPKDMSIEESIASTNMVISVSSTVLFQAYKSGRNIMIDNVNFGRVCKKLQLLDFIIYSKPYQELSDFLEANNILIEG